MKYMEPRKLTCDWCDTNPLFCFESKMKKRTGLIGTNRFYYSCVKHKRQLEDLAKTMRGNVIHIREKVVQKGY